MARMILVVWTLVSLAATGALAQSRPSIGGIEAQQQRITAAICAKADADGDTYRPFVCEARCDCFLPFGVPSSCTETSPGTLLIGFSTLPGTCSSSVCTNSSFQLCSAGVPCQIAGETCSGFIVQSCRRTCATNANCPPRPSGLAQLTGITTPDNPGAATCTVNTVVKEINSNDALQCLAQVEAFVSCP